MQTQTRSRAVPSIQQVLPAFKQLVPADVVRDMVKATGAHCYERLFTPLIVVWCFIYQRLNADHTLDDVVSHVSSGAADHLADRDRPALSERIQSQNTAAYSKARKRMPLAVLQGVAYRLAQACEQHLDATEHWRGHPVVLLDGATLVLRPEAELIEHYGRPRNQHGLSYWVVLRMVAAFSLHSAALMAVAEGPHLESEQSLAKTVLAQLPALSVCVADSNFGVFSVVQAARHHHAFALFRLTECRAKALARRTLRPGEDRLIQWAPSVHDQRDPALSDQPVAGRLIHVRLEREGFRPIDLYFFTTLLDASSYPVDELVTLYGRRWHAELDLRYVKSTLGMDLLTAKSVDMVRKELWAGLAAYNIVRAYMVVAAREAGLTPLDLSFAQCRRRVRDAINALLPTDAHNDVARRLWRLVARLGKCRLQKRLRFRIEPRAVRLRAVQYRALKGSRAQARQLELRRLLAEPAKC